jgi:hypothetical protein
MNEELLTSVQHGSETMKSSITAAEAFVGLYGTLSKEAGGMWLADIGLMMP